LAKKLAIVATHPVQYHSPWFRSLAESSGLQVRVFYLWDAGHSDSQDPGFAQPVRWDVPLLSGYDHEFVPNTSREAGTHHFFGLRNPRLLRRLQDYAPDAVLIFGYNYFSILNLVFRWSSRRAPLIMRGDSHRLIRGTGVREWLRRWLIARVFRRFSAFLYVGSANYDYFRYHGVAREALFYAPHAVDSARFAEAFEAACAAAARWKRELGIPEGDQVVLYAGKWEAKKRPVDLIKAFQLADLEGVSLLIVGSGPLAAELEAAAASCTKIYFAPFQNQTMMPRTYCAGDVFVLPSYGPGETWGLAVNEAMCMGRAVIVSDHVGCAKDLVHPYENGLVFEAGNTQALAQALRVAVSDPARLKAWGEHGRRLVQDYSFERATAGLCNALRAAGAIDTTSARP